MRGEKGRSTIQHTTFLNKHTRKGVGAYGMRGREIYYIEAGDTA